jgi:hypothetical protein
MVAAAFSHFISSIRVIIALPPENPKRRGIYIYLYKFEESSYHERKGQIGGMEVCHKTIDDFEVVHARGSKFDCFSHDVHSMGARGICVTVLTAGVE